MILQPFSRRNRKEFYARCYNLLVFKEKGELRKLKNSLSGVENATMKQAVVGN